MEMTATHTHYRTCNLCEAMCGLVIHLDGETILSIQGDKEDPFSQGHICPKAVALQDIYHDPDRLREPMRRTAHGWEVIGWDEAFEEVISNLKRIQKEHGRDAVGIYQGNPNVHNLGSLLFGPPFIRTLRTRNIFSATSVDQLPHHFAAYFMFGHFLLLPIPDIDRTDYLLMLGANPLASNGSLMTAPGVAERLKGIRQRGGQVIVVDPRRTESAAVATSHLFIRPGSDALFLLALLHTVETEQLATPGRLAEVTDGLERVRAIVADFAPEQVAGRVGIPAERIREVARDFCAAPSAVCYGRVGLSTQPFGGLCQWLITLLNLVTGNLDRPGGAMFTTPALDVVALTPHMGTAGRHGRYHSRVRGLPEFGGELPVAALAEEILTEGEGQIRALITNAGNPVLSTPNGRQVEQALASLEFMVAIDIYLNETTRHAHIILPPTTGLETEHYDLVFHALAVRNTAKYSSALFAPAPDAKHDWEILRELRLRMEGGGTTERTSPRARRDRFRRLPPSKLIDLGLRFGPYGGWGGKRGDQRLSLRVLREAVHGVDLGPLEPCLPERLTTPGKRIQATPDLLVQDLQRLRAQAVVYESVDGYDLALIGRRQLRSNNSWMHNSERLVRGKERCTLLLHPDDATARGIADGERVRVRSRVGEVELQAEVTEGIMPGVVSIPHGWGHHRPGTRLETAQQHAGVSLNDLTDERMLDELTGTTAFSGVPVQVERAVRVEG